jgi:hypothetical protein
MSEAYKFRKRRSPPPAILPGQRCMVFESRVLRGLSGPERMKVVRHLAQVLMLAAGVATEENALER